VNQDNNRPSLLLLLTSGQDGFRLNLTQAPRASRFPFACTPGAGPLAHLVDAAVTCGRTELAHLALLVQKDSYTEFSDGINELTNPQVDRLWQACRQYHLEPGNPAGMIDLAGGNDRFEPFRALFYCRSENVFFHPPCPACGRQLQLCTDDGLLKEAGLPAYSASLRRFMYCPGCSRRQDRAVFYARELTGSEPDHVQDCKALIRAWKNLAAQEGDTSLPCRDCERAAECFGPSMEVADNLTPFSFYPFYLLAFKDLHLNLKDFLPLLGAGSPDSGKTEWPGRKIRVRAIESMLKDRRLFISGGPDRLWLEVLHLKLCLLADLVRQVEAAGKALAAGISPWSIESFWVRLAPKASGLPLLWQFETVLADLAGKPLSHAMEKGLAAAHRRQFLAGAWFYVLLANSSQDAGRIMAALEQLASGDGRTAFDPGQISEWNPVFRPGQVFWQPRPVELAGEKAAHWAGTLELGLELLRAGLDPEPGFDSAEFLGRLDLLNRKIRQDLLSGPAESEPVPEPQDDLGQENRSLAALVGRIRQRWATTEPDQDGDWQETIVLSRAGGRLPAEDTARNRQPDAELEETVVLGKTAARNPEAELEKTVVRGHDPGKKETDDLAETVVLGPGRQNGSPSPAGKKDEEDLDKTVVMGQGPAAVQETTPGPPSPPETGDDDLEATLVLKPGNDKAGKK